MAPAIETTEQGVVIINYDDLVQGADLSGHIERAYGEGDECLGVLIVRGIPKYMDLRGKLLPLARVFADLPEETKEKYVHKSSQYNFGWSHGKEMMRPGELDVYKGSYYNNPQYNEPEKDAAKIEKYPAYCSPNVWPTSDVPELEDAFMNFGQMVVDVGALIGKQCDAFIKKRVPEHPDDLLYNTIRNSRSCKSRLLHYFPPTEEQLKTPEAVDQWCGWHLDHGSLTGLSKAMFLTKELKEVDNPDPEQAGLYIKNRGGQVIKVSFPNDCLAYQIGESSQIMSGGALRATWHYVRAPVNPNAPGISRNTMATFMQPDADAMFKLPGDKTPEDAAVKCFDKEMTFAEFSQKKFEDYYSWEK